MKRLLFLSLAMLIAASTSLEAMNLKQVAIKLIKDAPTEYLPGIATGAFCVHLATHKPRVSGSPIGNPAGELIQAAELGLKLAAFGVAFAGYYALVLAKKQPATPALTEMRMAKNMFAGIGAFVVGIPLLQYMTGQKITYNIRP